MRNNIICICVVLKHFFRLLTNRTVPSTNFRMQPMKVHSLHNNEFPLMHIEGCLRPQLIATAKEENDCCRRGFWVNNNCLMTLLVDWPWERGLNSDRILLLNRICLFHQLLNWEAFSGKCCRVYLHFLLHCSNTHYIDIDSYFWIDAVLLHYNQNLDTENSLLWCDTRRVTPLEIFHIEHCRNAQWCLWIITIKMC